MMRLLFCICISIAAPSTVYSQDENYKFYDKISIGYIIQQRGISNSHVIQQLISNCGSLVKPPIRSDERWEDIFDKDKRIRDYIVYYYEFWGRQSVDQATRQLSAFRRGRSDGVQMPDDVCLHENLLAMSGIRRTDTQTQPANPAPSTSTQPQVAAANPAPPPSAAAGISRRDVLGIKSMSSIEASFLPIFKRLPMEMKTQQEIWTVDKIVSGIEQLTPAAASALPPGFVSRYKDAQKILRERCNSGHPSIEGAPRDCGQGAFFGTPEERATIERAPYTPTPYQPDPKLKRVPAYNVNQCLTVDFKSLFGGFTNSCDFAIMYVYCVENPPKTAWSDAFRCEQGPKGIKALDTIGARQTSTAHTHKGRAIFFACAWQSKTGAGPDGIWGQTTYTEGVGTPGVIQGTCGEQVYTP